MKKTLHWLFFGPMNKENIPNDKVRHILQYNAYAGAVWMIISRYYMFKNSARDEIQGEFTMRDTLRYYGHDKAADRINSNLGVMTDEQIDNLSFAENDTSF